MSNIITSAAERAEQVLKFPTPSRFAGVPVSATHRATNVTMWLFKPRMLPQQVLRPVVYNFNQSVAETLANSPDRIREVGPAGEFSSDPMFLHSILPDANGIPLDMQSINSKWTFILFVEEQNEATMLTVPKAKSVYAGYFIDEPIAPGTWAAGNNVMLNPNAMMQFTHKSVLTNFEYACGMSRSAYNGLQPISSQDVFSQDMSMMCETDLRSLNPGRLFAGETSDGIQSVTFGNNLSGYANSNEVVPTYLNNPATHLRTIVRCIDNATAAQESFDYSSPDIEGSLFGCEVSSQFEHRCKERLVADGRGEASTRFGAQLSVNTCIPLTQLNEIYPQMQVVPMDQTYTSQWDVIPQEYQSAQVSLSNMIVSSIGAICSSTGIANIGFRYFSPAFNSTTGKRGVFELKELGTLAVVDDATQSKIFDSFTFMLERDLFPILRSVGGEFDLMVKYDIYGESLASYHRLDFKDEFNGFYETNNRFGGLFSPLLGNRDASEHNQSALCSLFHTIGDNLTGVSNLNSHLLNENIPFNPNYGQRNPSTIITTM